MRQTACRTVGQANVTCTECGLYSLSVDGAGRCPRCVSGVPAMNEAQLADYRHHAQQHEDRRRRDRDRRVRDAAARRGGRRVRRFG